MCWQLLLFHSRFNVVATQLILEVKIIDASDKRGAENRVSSDAGLREALLTKNIHLSIGSPGGPRSGKAGGSHRHGSAASICAGLCRPHPRTVDPRPPLGGHSGRSQAGECGTGPSPPARSDTCSVRSAAERAGLSLT